MGRLREIGHATVITHGQDSEVFTITPGLFIPYSAQWDAAAPHFKEGLKKYLADWFNPDGTPKRLTWALRNPDNAEVWHREENTGGSGEK